MTPANQMLIGMKMEDTVELALVLAEETKEETATAETKEETVEEVAVEA